MLIEIVNKINVTSVNFGLLELMLVVENMELVILNLLMALKKLVLKLIEKYYQNLLLMMPCLTSWTRNSKRASSRSSGFAM